MDYANFHFYLTCVVLVATPMVLARWVPTTQAREMALAAREELDARYSRKESADMAGLPLSDWSEQLNCLQPLNFYRLAPFMGTAFWDAFMRRLARLTGGEYIDPQTVRILDGAARLHRPMLSIAAVEAEKEIA
jgi:hypothetical protein